MELNQDYIKDVRSKVKIKANVERYKPSPNDGLYLFFSFDLVNSTSFKAMHRTKWPTVFSHFYALIGQMVPNHIPGTNIWKYIGDEVILYKRVTSKKDLFECLPILFNIKINVMKEINKAVVESTGNLFIKTTVWIANAKEVDIKSITMNNWEVNGNRNVIIGIGNRQDEHNNYIRSLEIDFLGPDIDSGFRISKYVEKDKIIVGAKLACCIYRIFIERDPMEDVLRKCYEERLKIVCYRKLKGIWNDRYYPIIWYHNHWDEPDKLLHYDDNLNSEIIRENYDRIVGEKLEKIDKLDKIFNDLNKTDEINQIIAELEKIELEKKEKTNNVDKYYESRKISKSRNTVEVHCSCICFNSKKQILIAKRKYSKETLLGRWEFGYGQLKEFEEWASCLKRSYKEDFNAELYFGKELIPISSYSIDHKGDKKISGIIFIGKIINAEHIKCLSNSYSKVDWFTIDNISKINENEYMLNFKPNVETALEVLEKNIGDFIENQNEITQSMVASGISKDENNDKSF